MPSRSEALIRASRRLSRACQRIRFHDPVGFVYNPLTYARDGHEEYLRRFGAGAKRVLFLGMNPGPWGMAQTGVPFGEVAAVRDWMGIARQVHPPVRQHPRVRITGFDCRRSEVSGSRLWGLVRGRFESPRKFFRSNMVVNYCPLLFLDESGRNLTPDKLRPGDKERLVRACDKHLREVVNLLRPEWLVGIGRFAQSRLEKLRDASEWKGIGVLGIPHPSPASPAANRDWAGRTTAILRKAGIW